MFCLYTSSKFSCPLFEFSLKVMGSNPDYLWNLFYFKVVVWAKSFWSVITSVNKGYMGSAAFVVRILLTWITFFKNSLIIKFSDSIFTANFNSSDQNLQLQEYEQDSERKAADLSYWWRKHISWIFFYGCPMPIVTSFISFSWLYLKERSQPTKSSIWETLFENIFWHYCPRQFKVQTPTGLGHSKWSLLKHLSSGCLVVVGIFRYIGLSANRQAKNFKIAKWPLEAAKWSGAIHEMLMDWWFDFGAMMVVRDVIFIN